MTKYLKFNIVCSYCNIQYDTKYYKNQLPTEDKIDKKRWEEKTSHGACKNCLDDVLKEIDTITLPENKRKGRYSETKSIIPSYIKDK